MANFEEVYAINVSDKTEKKGNLTYLSWSWAWAEFKKVYPEAKYKINAFDGTYCTGNDKMGYMVQTEVTAGEHTYDMWLPVMDSRNQAILQPKMTEINKAIMRCLTKNLAMFGLGLYIYAGEDLPEGEENASEGSRGETNGKNKPSNGNKTNDKAKSFEPITEKEMREIYRISEPKKHIEFYERQLGVKYADWGQEETEAVRSVLEDRKAKQLARERSEEGLKKVSEEYLPFGIGSSND